MTIFWFTLGFKERTFEPWVFKHVGLSFLHTQYLTAGERERGEKKKKTKKEKEEDIEKRRREDVEKKRKDNNNSNYEQQQQQTTR